MQRPCVSSAVKPRQLQNMDVVRSVFFTDGYYKNLAKLLGIVAVPELYNLKQTGFYGLMDTGISDASFIFAKFMNELRR